MLASIIILAVLALLMIAGAVPVKDGSQTAIFSTPVFLLTSAALAVSLLICSARRLRWRQIPFLLCHVGTVLILAGALARMVWAEKYEVSVPVTARHRAFNLRMPDGSARPLGFGLSATDFKVEFYDSTERKTPKSFEATLAFALPDDTTRESILAVNRPVHQGGWWFHLQSYDPAGHRFIIVAIKRDPGLPVALSGIWAVMIGTAGLCFRRKELTHVV